MIAAGWLDVNGHLADPTFKTTQQGAATQIWAATAPQLNGMGGLYCEDVRSHRWTQANHHPLSASGLMPPTLIKPNVFGRYPLNLPGLTLLKGNE